MFGRLLGTEFYLLQFASILLAGVFGGLGPGLVATALMAFGDRYLLFKSYDELVRLMIEGTLVSFVGGTLRAERLKVHQQLETNLQLERQILEISDNERRRIGGDLHDGLGQHLMGISLLSESIGQQLSRGDKLNPEKLGSITRLASEAVHITRDLARSLSPITLEREGLSRALAELAETSSSILGINCKYTSGRQAFALDRTRSLHVFRIVQEAVSNSVRHGKAKNVRIELTSDDSHVHATVVDDGRGLSAETTQKPGLGLRIMRYRANILGAELTVKRADASGGTMVSCKCPLKAPRN
jgi:signal transduction histidine kinase